MDLREWGALEVTQPESTEFTGNSHQTWQGNKALKRNFSSPCEA